MKKRNLFIAIVLFIIFMIFIQNDEEPIDTQKQEKNLLNQGLNEKNKPEIKKSPALNKQTHYENQAWHEVQSVNDITIPKPNINTPILAIQLDDPYILRHASEGDRLTFILPNHEAVIVEVQ